MSVHQICSSSKLKVAAPNKEAIKIAIPSGPKIREKKFRGTNFNFGADSKNVKYMCFGNSYEQGHFMRTRQSQKRATPV